MMGEAGPQRKDKWKGSGGGGDIYLTSRKATNKYQKRITETGPAKTDFTHAYSIHSLTTNGLGIEMGREEGIGPDLDYPHIYKLWALYARPMDSQRNTQDVLH